MARPDEGAPESADLTKHGLEQHRSGHLDEAAGLYIQAIEMAPANAEAHHLLGVARLAQQRLHEALPSLARAVELAPANPQYLANLGVALNAAENYNAAIAAFDRAIALRIDFAEAYSNRGMAYRGLGRFDEAVSSYEEAIRLKPAEGGFHFNLANVLEDAGRPHEALKSVERALELRPGHPGAVAAQVRILQALRRYDDAAVVAEAALARMPRDVDLLESLARILARTGHFQRAIAVRRRILELDGANGPALYGLAYSRRHATADLDLERLRRVFHDPAISRRNRVLAGFGYGKALADIGEHQSSHDVFVEANAMRRADQPYSLADGLAPLANLAAQFQTLPESLLHGGYTEAAPIFILGLPRAGKTTIELLLRRSPTVWAAGELEQLRRTVLELLPPDERKGVHALSRLHLDRIEPAALIQGGRKYADYVKALAPSGLVSIDTMPTNFILLGFIRLMLPNARIIHAVRDPLDHAVALFEKRFSRPVYGYTYSVSDISTYYSAYQRIMALWNRHWPGAVFQADVSKLRGNSEHIEELLDFCRIARPAGDLEVVSPEPELGALSDDEAELARAKHLQPYHEDFAGLLAHDGANAACANQP